jgi:hypothetical protein
MIIPEDKSELHTRRRENLKSHILTELCFEELLLYGLFCYQFVSQAVAVYTLYQWYSTFFVRVPPDIISLQLCTPKVVGT